MTTFIKTDDIMTVKVKVKKLHESAVLPQKAHPTDAGADLVATSMKWDDEGNLVYGTGLAFEIPEGFVGAIFPRSSIAKKEQILTNSVGLVDCHYRGEVMAKFAPTNKHIGGGSRYVVGDRIAQMVILPVLDVVYEAAEELSETDRGEGGYGSSGR